MSGDIYHLLVRTHSANPGPVSAWTAFKAFTRATVEGRFATPPVMTADSFVASDEWLAAEMFGEEISAIVDRHPPHQVTDALESRFGLLTDWVLARHKIEVDWSFGEIR
ncbi:MAG: hypothetical protein ACJ8BE_04910 [Microvirga sp.]